MNYYINSPGAFPLEIDVIAIKKEDDHFNELKVFDFILFIFFSVIQVQNE